MTPLVQALLPELILISVACVLLLMGVSPRPATRRLVPWIALLALAGVFAYQLVNHATTTLADPGNAVRVFHFAEYIKMLAAGVGILFVLLAWPSNLGPRGNAALNFGTEAGEFFGLMLLSISGVL